MLRWELLLVQANSHVQLNNHAASSIAQVMSNISMRQLVSDSVDGYRCAMDRARMSGTVSRDPQIDSSYGDSVPS